MPLVSLPEEVVEGIHFRLRVRSVDQDSTGAEEEVVHTWGIPRREVGTWVEDTACRGWVDNVRRVTVVEEALLRILAVGNPVELPPDTREVDIRRDTAGEEVVGGMVHAAFQLPEEAMPVDPMEQVLGPEPLQGGPS